MNNEKLQKEGYEIVEREDFIDELINWISEAKASDRYMMKEDLKELLLWDCEYIYSSKSTNEYIKIND